MAFPGPQGKSPQKENWPSTGPMAPWASGWKTRGPGPMGPKPMGTTHGPVLWAVFISFYPVWLCCAGLYLWCNIHAIPPDAKQAPRYQQGAQAYGTQPQGALYQQGAQAYGTQPQGALRTEGATPNE